MKKILLFLLLLTGVFNAYAANINKIVFFGDSLTDNGNLYSLLLHILPKSPPYFKGRFTNGETWAENVGHHYYNKNYADYKIYALGGATAVFHMPTPKFISPTILEAEVDTYLLDSLFRDRSKVLFAIWIGGNDYLFDSDANADSATDKVVNKIAWAVKTLSYYGGKNFLILNLPDLSRVPEARNKSMANLHVLTVLHNQKLDEAMQKIRQSNPGVNITQVNIYDMFNDVMADPEKYNQKYNVHLTNTAESCWKGGYLFSRILTDERLTQEIQQAVAAGNEKVPADFDARAMSNYILNTPALAYTYQMSMSYASGNMPCANPDEYIFWDSIHPTAVVHRILADIVIEKLGNQIG
ncbi:Phosphatidylcholine-sterol acyltransferase [Aquicella siphonis]|uniref:Phosphatidylcholine-sterol acyltransferase n=1 Tax=Aquicella siphonis TaxID=254247 RepID=A0A5E4PH23_9COXI|nr:SGNH/GDSL hydrolase family protein [Aquicella siphonis]VVC75653.1 Phosphatidylcholine-sterol acyltransferase [Aquicella siphonis]